MEQGPNRLGPAVAPDDAEIAGRTTHVTVEEIAMVPYNRIDRFRFPSSGFEVPVKDPGRAHRLSRVSARRKMNLLTDSPSRPTPEEIWFHAWLSERLLALHRERTGLWSRIRRFFLGDREDSVRDLQPVGPRVKSMFV
jgi:hypothetical protein